MDAHTTRRGFIVGAGMLAAVGTMPPQPIHADVASGIARV